MNSPACGRVEPKRGEGEVVGSAHRKQPQRNPPRPAIETIEYSSLQICTLSSAPPPQTGRPSRKRESAVDRTLANAKTTDGARSQKDRRHWTLGSVRAYSAAFWVFISVCTTESVICNAKNSGKCGRLGPNACSLSFLGQGMYRQILIRWSPLSTLVEGAVGESLDRERFLPGHCQSAWDGDWTRDVGQGVE